MTWFCSKDKNHSVMMMMMMMNCFHGMVDWRKVLNLISSQDQRHRSSPSRISDTTWVGFWTCTKPEFRLCWMKLCSSDNHYTTVPLHPHCLPGVSGAGGWTSDQIFQKGRGLTGSQFLEVGCLERRDEPFQGRLQFLHKKIN